jgi:hypothetical protein
MESSGRSGLRHRMVLLAALPFALAGFMLAPAAAADQGSPPATSIDAAEHSDSSGPGPSTLPGSTETDGSSSSEESNSTADSSSTEGTSSSGQSTPGAGPTEPAAPPEAEDQASEESSDEGSPQVTEPGATVPKAAPSQAAGDRQRAPRPKVTICHRTRSPLNPYNQITIAPAAIITRGHSGHEGPIFTPGLKRWGDIIPPVPPELPDGMNWPEGAPILNNGCEVPPPPDVGPQPGASIGEVVCDGATASVDVTVTNAANATAPADFAILVDGVVVQTVEGVPPGGSETVTLTGGADGLQEDATITVEVQSPPGGDVIATEVLTVNCAAPPPDVDVAAELVCEGEVPQGTATVTNNGQQPVDVSATVNGDPVGNVVTVDPGATETGTVNLSPFEDQTITVAILVDGVEEATYTVTPDCVAPIANPTVGVSGQVCPPPSATVTLGNTGDPDSQVVFVILVDGKVVQRSSPIFGGDTTTIVGDLSQFEDQTVVVELRANGKVLGSRTIHVNCTTVAGAGAGAGTGTSGSSAQPGSSTSSGVLPSVGAGFGPSVIALGLGLVLVGSLLTVAGSRRSRSRQA